MKKILVPTDFSSNANKALDLAVQVAKQAKADIILVHVCDLVDTTTFKDYLTIKEDYNKSILEKAVENLSLLKNSVEKTEKLTVSIKIYNGAVTESILLASEESAADLIIIGTRGKTELAERIFGSTTSALLGKTKVPLMVVSPLTKCDFTDKRVAEVLTGERGKFAPHALLFATSQFERNRELLNPIVDVARLFSATVHVAVFVDTDFAEAFDYVYYSGELDHYIKFLHQAYPDVTFMGELLEGEAFGSAIEEYNNKNGIGILALITYPKNFWDRLLKKTVTKEMAFNSKVPVIAITGQ